MLCEKYNKEKRIRRRRKDRSKNPGAVAMSTLCSPDVWAPIPSGYDNLSENVLVPSVPSRAV